MPTGITMTTSITPASNMPPCTGISSTRCGSSCTGRCFSSASVAAIFSRMRYLSLLLTALLIAPVRAADAPTTAPTAMPNRDEVVALMRKVGDWQIANLAPPRKQFPNDWIRSAFYTGVMALYDTTKDQKYLDNAIAWA